MASSANPKSISLIHVLAVLGLFAATGDVFFVFGVGGLTVRYTQVLLLAAVALYFTTPSSRSIKLPIGISFLLILFGLNLAFTPNAPFFSRALAYTVTFFLNVLTVFFYTNYYGLSPERLRSLLRWYIGSFIFVGGFGLLQFVSGLFGVSLLVTQWYIPGHFARLNGFSYEPSYFGLYIMCGWVTLALLTDSGSKIVSRRLLIWGLTILSFAEILSTSRSGMATMYIVFCLFVAYWIFKSLNGRPMGTTRKALAFIGLGAPILFIIYIVNYQFYLVTALTSGLGILEGGAAHSISHRVDGFARTVTLAEQHMIVGVSLGGIGPSIATNIFPGITYAQYLDGKIEGISVFMEVFAGVGIIGGFSLLIYLALQYQFLFWRDVRGSELYKVAFALGAGLLVELILLQAEQNIMRVYLWLHIAVFSTVTYALLAEHRRRVAVTASDPSFVANGPELAPEH